MSYIREEITDGTCDMEYKWIKRFQKKYELKEFLEKYNIDILNLQETPVFNYIPGYRSSTLHLQDLNHWILFSLKS